MGNSRAAAAAAITVAMTMATPAEIFRRQGTQSNRLLQTRARSTQKSTGRSFFAATVGVAAISKMELLQSICLLISRGALISMVVILIVLPAALMLCDWIIRHTTLKWMVPASANAKKSDKE